MNRKLFIGATAVTATVVGGLVYYRHVILEKLDLWLHPRHQWPEGEEMVTGYVNGEPTQLPRKFVDDNERGRPVRKNEPGEQLHQGDE